jgi:hypothetical protein
MEICAKLDGVTEFVVWYQGQQKLLDLIETHDLIVHVWENWAQDGKIPKLQIVPHAYVDSKKKSGPRQ